MQMQQQKVDDLLAQFEVLVDVKGSAGVLSLSRPQALNALTHGMIQLIRHYFDVWESDPAITHIILRSLSPKAFCAGGDVRAVYEMAKAGDPTWSAFFADEYCLNSRIKHYPKPVISLIDGIVMGGGVGLSGHGSYRIGSQKTLFAMPEVGIGFFPDVGASHMLPRLRSLEVGLYSALSGARLSQADSMWAGILTHCVPSERFTDLLQALTESADIDGVLAGFAGEPAEASVLAAHEGALQACFSKGSVAEILAALDAVSGEDAEWAQKTAGMIRSRSPMSVNVSFAELHKGATMEFDDCMVMEYRILHRVLEGNDFYEGIRAVLVEKDNLPDWQPKRFEDVDMAEVDTYFSEPKDGDLVLR
ncbi:enoyl-CoA hydratase/isomerase family protein [Breoghania sp.]|uniref:enoyl-CoA hydratase/isomerase family protein n=1 Tax=Breoghania sp. TaxID=2065378 RepID=UPI002AA8B25A|nr:enoyl-CoA hydratase/isomerase family protein [Breoghania sp.]